MSEKAAKRFIAALGLRLGLSEATRDLLDSDDHKKIDGTLRRSILASASALPEEKRKLKKLLSRKIDEWVQVLEASLRESVQGESEDDGADDAGGHAQLWALLTSRHDTAADLHAACRDVVSKARSGRSSHGHSQEAVWADQLRAMVMAVELDKTPHRLQSHLSVCAETLSELVAQCWESDLDSAGASTSSSSFSPFLPQMAARIDALTQILSHRLLVHCQCGVPTLSGRAVFSMARHLGSIVASQVATMALSNELNAMVRPLETFTGLSAVLVRHPSMPVQLLESNALHVWYSSSLGVNLVRRLGHDVGGCLRRMKRATRQAVCEVLRLCLAEAFRMHWDEFTTLDGMAQSLGPNESSIMQVRLVAACRWCADASEAASRSKGSIPERKQELRMKLVEFKATLRRANVSTALRSWILNSSPILRNSTANTSVMDLINGLDYQAWATLMSNAALVFGDGEGDGDDVDDGGDDADSGGEENGGEDKASGEEGNGGATAQPLFFFDTAPHMDIDAEDGPRELDVDASDTADVTEAIRQLGNEAGVGGVSDSENGDDEEDNEEDKVADSERLTSDLDQVMMGHAVERKTPTSSRTHKANGNAKRKLSAGEEGELDVHGDDHEEPPPSSTRRKKKKQTGKGGTVTAREAEATASTPRARKSTAKAATTAKKKRGKGSAAAEAPAPATPTTRRTRRRGSM